MPWGCVEGVEVQLCAFLTSALDGDALSPYGTEKKELMQDAKY
jgi:hypothetical protein